MIKLTKLIKLTKFRILVFLVVFLLGVALRLWKYPFYPFPGHAEEYLFVWSGMSLIEEGIPISWNDLPVYGEENIVFPGKIAENPAGGPGLGARFIKPWLDEPPLFSLLVGAAAELYGLENFTVVSPYVIRVPSIAFSFVTMLFVFLLARKYFDFWTGVLSLLIYATVPTFVFGARLAVPENLIAMLMVVILWLVLDYLKTNILWKRNAAIVLAALAGLSKPTGFLLVPFITFWLWKDRRWKEGAVAGIVGSLLFFVPYFLYGAYYNWELFWKVFSYQAQRPAGWSGLAYLITNPGFSVEIFLDGFVVLGFFSLAYLLFKRRNKGEEVVLLSFIFALLVVVFSGGRHDQLGWYRYPVYPFMAIATALLVKNVYKNPSFFSSAVFIPLALTNADLLANPFWKLKFFIESKFYRPALTLLLAPSILRFFSAEKTWVKLARLAIVVAFAGGIFFNIWVVKSWYNLKCDHQACSLPHKVDLLKPAFLK